MKRLFLYIALFASLTACTLSPRQSRGRTLSPDRETMTPDYVPEDSTSVRSDSLP